MYTLKASLNINQCIYQHPLCPPYYYYIRALNTHTRANTRYYTRPYTRPSLPRDHNNNNNNIRSNRSLTIRKVIEEACMSHYACNFFLYAITGSHFRTRAWQVRLILLLISVTCVSNHQCTVYTVQFNKYK